MIDSIKSKRFIKKELELVIPIIYFFSSSLNSNSIFLYINSLFLINSKSINLLLLIALPISENSFIIFELIAQAYLINFFYNLRKDLKNYINDFYLKTKRVLISCLIIVSVIILPFLPFDNFKFLKHALEWNVFLGVIIFYLLTHLMWKK